MAGIDHGLIGTNDGIHVLEKNDPRKHGMREARLLRLLVVLAKVPRSVEKLFWNDGSLDLHFAAGIEDAVFIFPPVLRRLWRLIHCIFERRCGGLHALFAPFKKVSHVRWDELIGHLLG